MINFTLLINSLPLLLKGAWVSIQLAAITILIGSIGGTLLALLFAYGTRFLKAVAYIYLMIIRGTPMFVQILIFYFVLPSIGISISAFWAATFAIGLNSIAYMSQVILSGIQSVGTGQVEAAQTLGFSKPQIARFIVLPQAFKTILPALGNEYITLIKDSSLASVIGVAELTHQGSIIMSKSYDALTVYAGVALIYLCITSLIGGILHIIMKGKINYAQN